MKKNSLTLPFAALILCAAFTLTSCNSIERPAVSDNGTISITFEQVNPETPATADEATRTGYHEKTIWWSEGDTVTYYQYATLSGAKKLTSSRYRVAAEGELLPAITVSFTEPDAETDAYYFSFFPKLSYGSYSTSSGNVRVRLTTPSRQEPTATKYDPNADLLISDYLSNLVQEGGKYSFKYSYYRQVAMGKMQIINLPSASKIDSIEISAIHDEANVTLAGAKWYDFTTKEPTSVYSRDYKLLLDYSEQDISGDMTAHFCCYPFELDADDSFTIKVTTSAGEVFTKKVTLSGSQLLNFEAGHATRFTVNMSTATKTDSRFTVNEYNRGSSVKTTNRVYYTLQTAATNVTSGKHIAVTEDVFSGVGDIAAYVDEHGATMSAASITSLNEGTSYVYNTGSLTGDTWYVVMVKLVFNDTTEAVAITRIKTDWFTLTAQTRAAGGITYYYYGKDLVSTTRNVRVMATADLPEGQTFETYYTSTLSPGGIPSKDLDAINERNGTSGFGYSTTKYYTGKSTTATMVPGTNYTVMVKAVNARGETKFVSVNANAGGTTE